MKIIKIGATLRSFFQLALPARGVLNKDLTVWLNRARSPPKYICKDMKINKKSCGRFVEQEAHA